MKLRLRWITGLLLIGCLVLPMGAFAQEGTQGASIWSQVKGKAPEERNQLLLTTILPKEKWQTGLVLNEDPFAVVAEYVPDGKELKAKVQVWTGTLYRSENKLITLWDTVWYGSDGKAAIVVTDTEYGIQDYFTADSQDRFRSLEFVGKYPWVSIPTDKEAAAAKLDQVAQAGTVSMYGAPLDGNPDVIAPESIQKLQDVPQRIGGEDAAPVKPAQLPNDIAQHWARDSIATLIGLGIVSGYQDGTIQPDKSLSRAEFATLLVKGLKLPTDGSEKSSYSDGATSWAKKSIAAAERAGIIAKAKTGQKFRPDEPITRMEMTNWLSNALVLLEQQDSGETVGFKDIAALKAADRNDIQKVINNGLLTGYKDGSFRPNNPLTRAEAFVVVLRMIRL